MVLQAQVQVQADMVILGAKEIKDAKLNESRQGLAQPQRGKEIYFLSVKHRVLEKRERKIAPTLGFTTLKWSQQP